VPTFPAWQVKFVDRLADTPGMKQKLALGALVTFLMVGAYLALAVMPAQAAPQVAVDCRMGETWDPTIPACVAQQLPQERTGRAITCPDGTNVQMRADGTVPCQKQGPSMCSDPVSCPAQHPAVAVDTPRAAVPAAQSAQSAQVPATTGRVPDMTGHVTAVVPVVAAAVYRDKSVLSGGLLRAI
jgi:hypothetical protein